jgi:hypothetical protein
VCRCRDGAGRALMARVCAHIRQCNSSEPYTRVAVLLAVSVTTASAQPAASLTSGFEFVDWLSTGRSETVGTGDVDTRTGCRRWQCC